MVLKINEGSVNTDVVLNTKGQSITLVYVDDNSRLG